MKKRRYICRKCNKTFHCKTIFINGIFSEDLKPILKVLSEENIIKEKPLDKEIMEKLKLNINSEWAILNEKSKVLTLLNKNTFEIKEFIKIRKNKIETKEDKLGKEWKHIEKIVEYKPLNRKANHKIIN